MHLLSFTLMFLIVWILPLSSQANETIKVVSWGGVYERAQRTAIFDPFTKATGITVNSVTYSGGVETLNNRAARENWDVIDMIEDQAIRACDAGLLAKIKADQVSVAYQSIPVLEDYLPEAFRSCSVAQNVYATVFAYDDRAFLGEKPETVADFFDLDRFPGKRALLRDPDVILEWALMAEGVPINQIYNLLSTDRGLRLAFRKLENLRGSIVWWKEVGEPSAMLADKRVVMASGYNGRFFSATQEDGIPLKIVWDGQVISYAVWAMLQSTKKRTINEQFLRFATAPEQMAALAELIPYGPTRQSALSRIGLHVKSGVPMRDHLPNAPQHMDRALYGDNLWYARTRVLRLRRFEAWLGKDD